MQDAVLIYYMMANLLRAGYFADIAKVVQQAVTQLRVAVAGLLLFMLLVFKIL